MRRYFAFLRAVNVGGHAVVKMDRLRGLFDSLGFSEVETFLASGNVVFDSTARSAGSLEARIEAALRDALGHEVPTFVRTAAELARIATHRAFLEPEVRSAAALNVAFLKAPPDPASIRKIEALETAIDRFSVHEREVYWLCRRRQSESKFSSASLERTLGVRSTMRGASTVERMVARYAPAFSRKPGTADRRGTVDNRPPRRRLESPG